LYTDNDASSVVKHKTRTITVQTETVHTKPLTHGLIISSVTQKPFTDTHNKILYTFNNETALDTDVESKLTRHNHFVPDRNPANTKNLAVP